ncbi:MAG: inositol monophosphatase [Victivallaceae bacterium]|nr:inositol monophosphatase [Victivallaceae bacterium]
MLKKIMDIAQQAGELAMKRRATLSVSQVHTKATPTDLVTDVDREVENFIIGALRELTPDYDVFGEETGRKSTGSPYMWVIDPIDGTHNFVCDMPFYCTSIGLRKNGIGVMGAIFAPRLGELFAAEAGSGATLNGKPISVSKTSDIGKAMLATGFSCVRARRSFDNLRLIEKPVHAACGFRRDGSAAIDLAYVAAGRYDGFWELALNDYDIAAGELMIREAGGIVTDFHGGTAYPTHGIIASNGLLQPVLHSLLDRPEVRFE